MNPRRLALACFCLVFTLFMASLVAEEQLDADAARLANDIAHGVLSPFCPGKTLAMCPSPAAGEVRLKIQGMAQSGMNEAQIKDAIIAEHGEEFRIIEPPAADNFGLLGALGGGLALAVFAVVIISRRRGATPVSDASDAATNEVPDSEADEPDDEYLAELRKQYRD